MKRVDLFNFILVVAWLSSCHLSVVKRPTIFCLEILRKEKLQFNSVNSLFLSNLPRLSGNLLHCLHLKCWPTVYIGSVYWQSRLTVFTAKVTKHMSSILGKCKNALSLRLGNQQIESTKLSKSHFFSFFPHIPTERIS